jgi:hypothetical protein
VRWAWDIACPIIVIVHPLSNLPPCWQSARLILYMSSGDPITPANYKAVWAQGTKTTNCSNLYIFFLHISRGLLAMAQIGADRGLINLYRGGAALRTLRIGDEPSAFPRRLGRDEPT